jgi:hypothetical protein
MLRVERAAMSDRKSAKPTDYAVGYRRPPTASQFRPGKSGNPKGRPKGSRPVGAVLRDVIRQTITVTENGKTRRIPVLEVMFRRLAHDAMRSDPKALKLLLSLVDRYAESPETELQLGEVLAEDQAILAQYLPEPAGCMQSRPRLRFNFVRCWPKVKETSKRSAGRRSISSPSSIARISRSQPASSAILLSAIT